MSGAHNTIIGTFQRRSLNKSLRIQVERGLCELDAAAEGRLKHGLPTLGFFGSYVEASEMSGYLFIYAANGLRPARFKLLALSNDGEVLLPSVHETEFFKIVHSLSISGLQNVVTFYSLTYKDYGVYEKGCSPKHIQTEIDAQRYGFDLCRYSENLSSKEESLWWQEWGGTLFSIQYKPQELMIRSRVVDSFVGNCQPLPLKILR